MCEGRAGPLSGGGGGGGFIDRNDGSAGCSCCSCAACEGDGGFAAARAVKRVCRSCRCRNRCRSAGAAPAGAARPLLLQAPPVLARRAATKGACCAGSRPQGVDIGGRWSAALLSAGR